MKLHAFMASVVLAAMTASANAGTIERTFDVTASGFSFLGGGPGTPAAIDPVEMNFTLIWNPSVAIGATTSGLTINSFTLPNPPYSSAFASDGAGTLTIATLPFVDGCSNPASTYCFFISDPTSANPTVGSFEQLTSSDGFWLSDTVTVTAGAIEAVPEPSTWALMLIGFGGMGWLLRSRRRTPAVA
jgi:hypothetical protein